MIQVERREGGCGALCREILAGLPDWFGIPEANEAYAHDAEARPTWVALEDGAPVGLMILRWHGADAVEISLIAVQHSRRNTGIGRALIAAAEQAGRSAQTRFLTVKTRGPSAPTPSAEYDETRAFYRALGFFVLEEFPTLWDPNNPALFLLKPLQNGKASPVDST